MTWYSNRDRRGEEDDVIGEKSSKLYTTPEDTLEVARRLNSIGGRYLLAATFGNVHGVYKSGHVKLKARRVERVSGGCRQGAR